MRKLLLETTCPHCHADLNRGEWIDLGFRLPDGRQGAISLSAYFGDYSVKMPFFVEEGVLAMLACPHCQADLTSERKCSLCAAPMFSLGIKTGGAIDVCSRRGCKGHALGGFGDPDEMILLVNKLVDTPYL
jgi:RNA polymerase subunit RPABC4/transcription elongation factor Spt4